MRRRELHNYKPLGFEKTSYFMQEKQEILKKDKSLTESEEDKDMLKALKKIQERLDRMVFKIAQSNAPLKEK